MISKEEYELEYSIYEANSEFYKDIIKCNSSIPVTEISSLQYIEEGVKDSITKYLAKIVSSMQTAWSKFQGKITEKETKFLADNKDKILNAKQNLDFTIKNFKKINHDKIDAIKVVPWSDEMKEIKSKEEFISKYYPQLDPSNYKESLKKTFYGEPEDVKVDGELLNKMYTFCTDTFNNLKGKIEEGIKVIDSSNQNIVNSLNQVSSAEESYYFIESILLEDDNNNEKMTIVDNSTGEEATKPSNMLKAVSTYVSVSSSIISTKMVALLKEYFQNLKVLKYFARQNGSDDESSNNGEPVKVEKIIK